MELPKNPFKQALASGTAQFGLFLGLPDNSAAEIVATTGFDWLLLDHEHAPFDLPAILRHLQVLAAYDVAPVVRPASDDATLLKKLLDIGVQSFLVPMVDTPEQAAALVRALRYPPAGIRGIGTSMARAAHWNQVPGYVADANAQICLIVQAETTLALDNLEAILAVEGVDGVFIGPSDLSASMGYPGNPGHPEVVSAINTALEKICAAQKHAGLFCMDPAMAQQYIQRGANFLAVGTDTMILSQGASATAQRFRDGKPAESPEPRAGY